MRYGPTDYEQRVLTLMGNHKWLPLELHKALNSERLIPITLASVLFTLHKLERKGFLVSNWVEMQSTTGEARRKYYQTISIENSANDVEV